MAVKDNPENFWPLCGNSKIAGFLQQAVTTGRVAHAYLFVGPAGLGKQTFARQFVGALLCRADKKPCGLCQDCRQITAGVHPDLYLVERQSDEKTGKLKKDIVIDQIRDLKSRMSQASMLGGYKAAIISEAQLVNEKAANAILKLLEEPTPRTVIILITDDISSLPATVASRCQVLKFLPVPEQEIEKCLAASGVDNARAIARLAGGRPGVALSLAATPERWQSRQDNVSNFLSLLEAVPEKRLAVAGDLVDWSDEEAINADRLRAVFDDWQAVLRDLLLIGSDNQALVAHLDFLPALEKLAGSRAVRQWSHLLFQLDEARRYLRQNISAKNVLENLMINL